MPRHSPPCSVKGCLDLNDLAESLAAYNANHGTSFNVQHDSAVFSLGQRATEVPCGCELRGGGTSRSPLHLHYCSRHSLGASLVDLTAAAASLGITEGEAVTEFFDTAEEARADLLADYLHAAHEADESFSERQVHRTRPQDGPYPRIPNPYTKTGVSRLLRRLPKPYGRLSWANRG